MVTTPSLRDLLKAGVHFGHKTARWNPNMAKYIFTAKAGVHVINLEETTKAMQTAADFLAGLAKESKTVIFVGTKKQASDIVTKAADSCGMPYINHRWLGGMLTNFLVIKKSIDRFKQDKAHLESNDLDLSKRDLTKLRDNVAKKEKIFGGLTKLTQKPDALILIGAHDEKNALREARLAGLPVVALVDTNANPQLIDYPVPANDDATKSVELFVKYFAEVIKVNKPVVKKEKE